MIALAGKLIWAAGIISWYIIRLPFERRSPTTRRRLARRSTSERIGLVAATLGLGVVPGLYTATNFPRSADYPATTLAVIVGTLIYITGLWLFRRSHKDLGRNWSITLEIREQHNLVSNGVYRLVRHPMYSAFWLMGLGQAFLLPNWFAGLAGLVGFGVLYFLRVDKEEQMMLQTFGDQYRDYMSRTRRIIPHLH